jgi:glycosyltransferase involved in cell wall biosynthesis
VTDVVIATLATGAAMGQQEYEQQLADHLPTVAPDLGLRTVRVRSLRSSLPGESRLPLRAVSRLPDRVQHLLARAAYGRGTLVHRCDLRLPPAAREVVTVHDLAPLRFADEGMLGPNVKTSLRRAVAVIVPSHFAAAELRDRLHVEGAVVIPNGLRADVWEPVPDAADLLAQTGAPNRFVLHSGGATQRKNLSGLAGAWREVAARHPDVGLVLCGPPDERRTALFAGLPRVLAPGRVPRPALLSLMSAADVVVVPSTYEGFGFPALEAMARGTAVVAADCSSLPEVCGDAAVLVTPTATALGSALHEVLSDDSARSRLEAAGPVQARRFNWTDNARAHAEVYRQAVAKGSARQ